MGIVGIGQGYSCTPMLMELVKKNKVFTCQGFNCMTECVLVEFHQCKCLQLGQRPFQRALVNGVGLLQGTTKFYDVNVTPRGHPGAHSAHK